MADISEKIGPLVESLLEPGETLEGRLIVQEIDRKQRPHGEPTFSGERLKLAVGKGGGPLGGLMGGPTQEN
ncbi:MAG: hypothetical protein ABWY79_03405, partial [Solirubrobacterales bacterium]